MVFVYSYDFLANSVPHQSMGNPFWSISFLGMIRFSFQKTVHAPQHINLCQLQAVDRLGNTVILAAVDEERATTQHAPESLEWLGWVPLDEHVTLHTDPGGHAGMVGGTPAAGQTEETHRERGARLHARVAPASTKLRDTGRCNRPM